MVMASLLLLSYVIICHILFFGFILWSLHVTFVVISQCWGWGIVWEDCGWEFTADWGGCNGVCETNLWRCPIHASDVCSPPWPQGEMCFILVLHCLTTCLSQCFVSLSKLMASFLMLTAREYPLCESHGSSSEDYWLWAGQEVCTEFVLLSSPSHHVLVKLCW